MWSIWSSGIASSAAVPEVDEPTRRPSISTSVWLLLAPRRKTPLVEAGPPFMMISTPGRRRSSSARLCAPARAISSGPITVTSATSSDQGCGARAAVTTRDRAPPRPARAAPCADAAQQARAAMNKRDRGSAAERTIAFLRNAVRPRTAASRCNAEKTFGASARVGGIRPDTASRDAPRSGALHEARKAPRGRPVSGLAGTRLAHATRRAARLPMRNAHSGISDRPHRLTVAGAAPE